MKSKTTLTAIILVLSFVLIVFYIVQAGISLSSEQRSVLTLLIKIYLGASIYCIISSEITGNYSQVDRLWSTIPIVYAWVASNCDDFGWRSVIAAVLITLWGIRLSYNFALKGGFSWLPWKGEEDYRWAYLRKDSILSNIWVWRLFNVFFISLYQMGLILYFTLPVVLTVGNSGRAFNIIDGIAIAGFLFFLGIETLADIQQFKFQKEKYRRIESGEELGSVYGRGFIRSGLWAYMRHPNYMGEQMIWAMVYLLGVAASGLWINWTIGGFILLVLLFWGSSDFSEKISSGKYPEYKNYQSEVGRFFPRIF